MSVRMERINSEMARSLADIIRNRLKDPRITEMVSVMDADVAKDLKTAKIYISIYGNKDKCLSTFEAINNCAGYIRKELAVDFKTLRVVPQLTFILDTSMEYSQKISAIMEDIKKNDNH